jgi:hypothetical protein
MIIVSFKSCRKMTAIKRGESVYQEKGDSSNKKTGLGKARRHTIVGN